MPCYVYANDQVLAIEPIREGPLAVSVHKPENLVLLIETVDLP